MSASAFRIRSDELQRVMASSSLRADVISAINAACSSEDPIEAIEA